MRDRIEAVLIREGHGCTFDYLMQEINFLAAMPNSVMLAELEEMENDRVVILHRDSSAGYRLSGHGIALVCLRGDL